MRQLFLFLCLFMIIAVVSGCRRHETVRDLQPAAGGEIVEEAGLAPVQTEIEPWTAYIEKNMSLSIYEPAEGCYSGAHILSDSLVDYDIESFETLMEKKHCLYVYKMKLGDTFPTRWYLSCLSLMKTPYIVIQAPNDYDPYNLQLVADAAAEFGRLYVPVFIDFFPSPEANNLDAHAYVEFYRAARDMFRQYASNTAFVWSVDYQDAAGSNLYYPGDDYVDWVGVNAKMHVTDKGYDTSAVISGIDFMYYSFQKKKPLVLADISVSHFTAEDHTYHTRSASAEIEAIYETVRINYPRVKAINYFSESDGTDNFYVTSDNAIKNSYKAAVRPDYFLSELVFTVPGEEQPQLIKSPFPAYKSAGEVYIDHNTIVFDLNLSGLSELTGSRVAFGGLVYYNADILSYNRLRQVVEDEQNKKIYLK